MVHEKIIVLHENQKVGIQCCERQRCLDESVYVQFRAHFEWSISELPVASPCCLRKSLRSKSFA